MSLMVNGELRDNWFESEQDDGEFIRQDSQFRNWVTADGRAGPGGEGGFRAEPGRYHLFVSLACPWAHRTLIFRALKGLADAISVDIVHPHMGNAGWHFGEFEGRSGDNLYQKRFLHEVYREADPHYSGIVTVPVLWDKQRETIVNNESSEIIRMLNSAFDAFTDNRTDYYPQALRADIDAVNELVYENINNGVYRTGFATTQTAYDHAFKRLFSALDLIEERLDRQRYLVGDVVTEADWRLLTTLLRFDTVYYNHFKCNRNRIEDYPNLSSYLRDLYQTPGVAETTSLSHIKQHYFWSHDSINPTRIVPRGPHLDWHRPHDRERLSPA